MKEEDRLREVVGQRLAVGDTALAQFIGFFMKRVKIEDEHATLCLRLAQESSQMASNTGIEMLWSPFLDSCRRDAQQRHQMVAMIRTHILPRLEGFKAKRALDVERMLNDVFLAEASAFQALSKSREDVLKLKQSYREKGNKLQQMNQSKETNLPKSLKLQKDLAVAEMEYRQAIWKREEERLRHAVMLESASMYTDLERQAADIGQQMSVDYRTGIAAIDIETERANYVRFIEDSWPQYAPIHYWHLSDCELKDLVFGVPLDVQLRSSNRQVPFILQKCIQAIEQRGLTKEGIYRISAKHSDIMDLRQKLEWDVSKVSLEDEIYDVHAICGVVKMFLRELPKPLLEIPDIERKEFPQKSPEDRVRSIQFFLKNENKATLKYLIFHLALVAQYSEVNKMTPQNLAVVFGPPILTSTQRDMPSDGPKTKTQQFLDKMQQNFPFPNTNNSNSNQMSAAQSATDLGLNLELAKNDMIIEELIRYRDQIFPQDKPKKEKKPKQISDFPSRIDSLQVAVQTTLSVQYPTPAPISSSSVASSSSLSASSQQPISMNDQIPMPPPVPAIPPQQQQQQQQQQNGIPVPSPIAIQPPVQMSVPAPMPITHLSTSAPTSNPVMSPTLATTSPSALTALDVPPPPPSMAAMQYLQQQQQLQQLQQQPQQPPLSPPSTSPIANPQSPLSAVSSPSDPLIAQAWKPSHSFPASAPLPNVIGPVTPAVTPYRAPSNGQGPFSFLAPSVASGAMPANGGAAAGAAVGTSPPRDAMLGGLGSPSLL
ncbi:hypothetical protein HDU97_005523 [Phlyctochytrium planicorne]|nr:hypothetical protein HDU97_005523 [Phlyctochytrium planicorne]